MNLDLAPTLSRPALLVLLHWEQRGAAPVGRLAQVLDLSERSVHRALAELREAKVGPPTSLAHDHGLQHGDQRNDATDVAAPAGPVGELVRAGIWEGAARRLVDQHGEDRVRVQLAHHQVRLDGGFSFRSSPAAHLYAAIVHDYAPWVPPAPGTREAENRRYSRATTSAISPADYGPAAQTREEACEGFARHREAIRAALGRR